jgi:hypothetical protein
MQKSYLGFYVMVAALAGFIVLPAASYVQTQHQESSNQQDSLIRFLQDYVGTTESTDDTSYFSGFVDLNGDGKPEVIVYLKGSSWCGSGGCTTLILTPKGLSYKLVTKVTITRLPIRVLTSKSNGWHDLSVRVQGGGVSHAYEAKLSFNGITYPSNPSRPPARRLGKKAAGKEVVSLTSEGTALY